MNKEELYKEVMWKVKDLEIVVRRGESGLVEIREIWLWLGENDEEGVYDGMKIVESVNEDVRKVLLCGFIENFCE